MIESDDGAASGSIAMGRRARAHTHRRCISKGRLGGISVMLPWAGKGAYGERIS